MPIKIEMIPGSMNPGVVPGNHLGNNTGSHLESNAETFRVARTIPCPSKAPHASPLSARGSYLAIPGVTNDTAIGYAHVNILSPGVNPTARWWESKHS
jgi:hypothetical protein